MRIQIDGLFFLVMISVGVFKAEKMVVISFCLFLLCCCIPNWVSGFAKADFSWFQKISIGRRANRAVMFCWIGAKKVKTKVHGQNQGRV